jgi:hypothetical protein
MAFAPPTHGLREHKHLDRLDRAIRLRPAADADEAARLDVTYRRRDDAYKRKTGLQRHHHALAGAGFMVSRASSNPATVPRKRCCCCAMAGNAIKPSTSAAMAGLSMSCLLKLSSEATPRQRHDQWLGTASANTFA